MDRRSFLTNSIPALTLASSAGARVAAGAGAATEAGGPAAAASIAPEPVVDPLWPIIDAHHHLWDFPARDGRPARSYLLRDFLADVAAGGHNIVASVFDECMTMYRVAGPSELRSLGETEFANGIAAMSASGNYGQCRVAEGIVAFVDLRPGDAAKPVLEAHLAAAGKRLKGVRNPSAWDPYPVMGIALPHARAEWLSDPGLRTGVAMLAAHDLVFECWVFHTQIPDVSELAARVPQATIVLGHCGTPIGVGPYAAAGNDTFANWKRSLVELARRPNVVVKLGGLGMAFVSPALAARKPPASSAEIAAAWGPYVETCIEAFGPGRCMFESNFPPDSASCSYRTLWNAFKRIAAGYSASERTQLFSGTAQRVFRLGSD